MKFSAITLSTNEKIEFFSNFGTMLSAGIPILEVVESLLEDAKGNQKKLLETVLADLNQGQHLSTSLAKFPDVFDQVTINLLRAAEESGNLDITLKDIKDSIKQQAEFNDKIRSAMIYPVIILVVFIGVMLMILTFVIPRISSVFSRLHLQLPLPTRILIFLSQVLLQYTLIIAVGTVLLIALAVFIYIKQKRAVLNTLGSLPIISTLVIQIDLARFTHSMYMLLKAGIPITSVLDMSEHVVIRSDIRNVIVHCKNTVASGKKLSDGLKDAKKTIPSIMTKIIEAGERTGTLEKSMQDISEYLNYEVSNTLRNVTVLIEPVMLVVIGVLVGGMMLGIIAPIYGLIGQISGR